MFNTLGNSIPRNGLVWEWVLDGNALDTSWSWNNWTATNVTYVKTDRWYQSQAWLIYSWTSTSSNKITTTYSLWAVDFSLSCWINKNNFKTWANNEDTIFWNRSYPNWWFLCFNESWWATNKISLPYWTNVWHWNTIFTTNRWYHIVFVQQWNTQKIYVDWNLEISTSFTQVSSWTNFTIWNASTTLDRALAWTIQWVRLYNRVLSQDESQILYLEGLRKLWPTATPKYPALLSGLVGYFRAEDTWWTTLYNLVNWITATRVGWTNTADNLWINKAISNPNYTWSSLTYTTGYTFENSWSWWSLVTTPAWLSATWINRTTTLRDIFLFSRTLSTDERNLLESLCNSEYPYPTPSYDIASLRDGLVLDLNEQWLDLSWNGNNGTLVNSPAVIRQWRAKGLSYNGSNQYMTIPDSSLLDTWLQTPTINLWIKTTNTTGYNMCLWKWNSSWFTAWALNFNWDWSNQIQFWVYDTSDKRSRISTTAFDWKWHMITATWDWTKFKIYVDWVEASSYLLQTTTPRTMPNTDWLLHIWKAYWSSIYYNWNIVRPRIRNRALSDKEIQTLYYSQKANFIY